MDSLQFSGKPRDVAAEMARTIPVNFQEPFSRVVKAGMKVMFSEQTHDMMIEELSQEGDLGQRAGQAIAGLMLLLYQKSNQTMPGEVIIPAGTYLLSEAADFIEKITGEEVTPDILADAMQVMIDTLCEKFGIPPENLVAAAEKASAGGYK
jgi:hypothetical protein